MNSSASPKPAAGVSVIICTWNRAEQLRATLTTLSEQQVASGGDFEVVVVDNNSTDCTRNVVEEMQASWHFGVLRYAFEPRQGKQYALNTGIGVARFDLLAFTDDDILVAGNWLQSIRNLFAGSGAELAGGRTLVDWPDQGRPAWFNDDMQAIVGCVDLGQELLDPAPNSYAPGGGNLIAKRSLIDRVGPFSETHFRHMDFEFGMRCQRAGARVVYDPRIVVRAPVDAAMLTRRYFRRWSFKSGISRGGGIDAARQQAQAVPLWLYRQLVEDAWYCCVAGRFAAPEVAFSRELRMWRAWGTIANVWHARMRPKRHAAWVEWHSQKKNNTYA